MLFAGTPVAQEVAVANQTRALIVAELTHRALVLDFAAVHDALRARTFGFLDRPCQHGCGFCGLVGDFVCPVRRQLLQRFLAIESCKGLLELRVVGDHLGQHLEAVEMLRGQLDR